ETGRMDLGLLYMAHPLVVARESPEARDLARKLVSSYRRYGPPNYTLTQLLSHAGPVHSAGFSPDGRHVVTASEDGTARVWDTKTGKPVTPAFTHAGGAWSAAFSPDGRLVVTAGWDQMARVWEVENGRPATPPMQHLGPVTFVEFSPDGQRVL